MIVGLLGFLRRFPSLFPPIKSCFPEQISVAMAVQRVSPTVVFSLLPESVVSANKVLLTVITIVSTFSGKNTFKPRVVFIIPSMGWCVFASILGVSMPNLEWRRIFRLFIFLLVMEGNWYRRLLKVTLGIAKDMENFEPKDRMFRLALLEETHGGWHYMLSMEVMEVDFGRVVVCFTHGDFPGVLGVFGSSNSDFMIFYNPQRIWDLGIILEAFGVKISTDDYGAKCTIGWAYTGATRLFYVMWSFNERMLKRHTYHIRERWILKKEYIMFFNMIASKAYRKEASSISLFHLCPLQHMVHISAYVKVCFCEVLYELNTVVILVI